MAEKSMMDLLREDGILSDDNEINEKPEAAPEQEAPESEEVSDEVATEEQETAEADAEVADTEAEESQQEAAAEAQNVLDTRAVLSEIGISTEGLSDEDIRKSLANLVKRKSEPAPIEFQEEAEEPEEKEPEQETAQERQRKVARLQARMEAREYVDFEDGVAVPKKEYGETAVKAAKELNDYMAARRVRAQEFIDDPIGYMQEDLEHIVADQVKAGIEAYKQEQAQRESLTQAEQAKLSEQDRLSQLVAEYTPEIYKVGKDGKPIQGLDSESPLLTEFGEIVGQEYDRLVAIVPPETSPAQVLEYAYETAKKVYQAPQPEPTPKEKKKKFLEKRNQTKPSASSPVPAQPQEVAEHGGKTSLLEAIMADEENADNPALAALRQ